MPYRIVYSPEAEEHLRALTARQRSLVFDAVDKQLPHEPGLETRNRKPMRPNSVAPWELRIGELRVFFDIAETPNSCVTILAVGIKKGNRVFVAGEEFTL